MRTVLYARVSTEEQVDGYSIEGQLDTTPMSVGGRSRRNTLTLASQPVRTTGLLSSA